VIDSSFVLVTVKRDVFLFAAQTPVVKESVVKEIWKNLFVAAKPNHVPEPRKIFI
jgi:hypothetical protein